MMEFKSSKNGFNRLRVCPNLSWMIIGGYDDTLRSDWHSGSFDFCSERIMICPDLDIIT